MGFKSLYFLKLEGARVEVHYQGKAGSWTEGPLGWLRIPRDPRTRFA